MKERKTETESEKTRQNQDKDEIYTHSALVWLLSCVSAHMNNQHILGFERPLFSRALLPVTYKLLLLSVDVLIVNVLQIKQIKEGRPIKNQSHIL